MLKEVMLGSGGIMLAAAIFVSSMAPAVDPDATTLAVAPPVATAPIVAAPPAAAPRPAFVPDQSGDINFGAPMLETTPLASETGGDAPMPAATDPAEAHGGRQFYSVPGRPDPIPR